MWTQVLTFPMKCKEVSSIVIRILRSIISTSFLFLIKSLKRDKVMRRFAWLYHLFHSMKIKNYKCFNISLWWNINKKNSFWLKRRPVTVKEGKFFALLNHLTSSPQQRRKTVVKVLLLYIFRVLTLSLP